jgi:hypothetical protein
MLVRFGCAFAMASMVMAARSSREARITRARNASACAVVVRRAHLSSAVRSSAASTMEVKNAVGMTPSRKTMDRLISIATYVNY